MLRLCVLVVAAGTAAAAALAQPPDIPALVARLGADDFHDRERAGAELLTLGKAAVPELRAAHARATDPEVARRLEVLAERLEAVALTEPTRVTLKVERRPGREVFDELATRTGAKFLCDGSPRDALITFDWDGVPFLEALDRLCDVLQLTWEVNEFDHTIRVEGTVESTPHVAYAGPFRVAAESVALKSEVRVGGVERRQAVARPPAELTVRFLVCSEPRLPICALGKSVLLAAEDEFGNSLVPPPEPEPPPTGAPAPRPVPTERGHRAWGTVAMHRASRHAEFVKFCRVRVEVACVAEVRPEVVVADATKCRGQKYTGRTHLLEVGESHVVEGRVEINVTVLPKFDKHGGPAEDVSMTPSVRERFELSDGQGRALGYSSHLTTSSDGGASGALSVYGLRNWQARPRVVRLQFVEWVVKYQTVEFTFRDLPLP